MKCPEKTNLQRQKTDQWPEWDWGLIINQVQAICGSDENFIKLIVALENSFLYVTQKAQQKKIG